MGKDTEIEWADHTFNPWWGCVEVPLPSGSACDHCYARATSGRYGRAKWGANEMRSLASETVWAQPARWDSAASAAGRRDTVFCSSMSDVFEPRNDLDDSRERLFRLIQQTPNLIWLLLTKRPATLQLYGSRLSNLENVAIGVTVESQEALNSRKRVITSIDLPVFLSCEPLLSPIVFDGDWLGGISWVICGGESGHQARPMQPDWARSLRDQVKSAGVPFFFKQWGQHTDGLVKLQSKKATGRLLDGREWNEYPSWFGRKA